MRKMPPVKFIFFADGGAEYLAAAARLSAQIKRLYSNASVEIYNLERIAREDPLGYKLHGEFIQKNSRGLGFWLWKPWIHKIALDNFPNETLIYLDVGCDILVNHSSRKRFDQYLAQAEKSGLFI
jgi:hypothetical protein